MTFQQVVLFAVWAGVGLGCVVVLSWGVPTVARMRFLLRIERLHARAVDYMIAGVLPKDDAAVREFLAIQDVFWGRSREFTLARVIAYDMAFRRMGVSARERASRGQLDARQRLLLNELESQSKEALADYLVWGSPLGYLRLLARKLISVRLPALSPRPVPDPAKRALAGETYARTRDRVKGKLPSFPTIPTPIAIPALR